MAFDFFHRAGVLIAGLSLSLSVSAAFAESRHGIAMYGEPGLPPDFVSLPYVNPDAPKGGRYVVGNTGSFDSLNPFVQKGNPPWQFQFWAFESLLGRSWDEPFTLYGLLAESVESRTLALLTATAATADDDRGATPLSDELDWPTTPALLRAAGEGYGDHRAAISDGDGQP